MHWCMQTYDTQLNSIEFDVKMLQKDWCACIRIYIYVYIYIYIYILVRPTNS